MNASFGDVGTAASTPLGTTQDKPDATGNGDVVIGPDYEVDPDLKDKGNPKGQAFEFPMTLADSKIFPGNDSTLDPKKPVNKTRKISERERILPTVASAIRVMFVSFKVNSRAQRDWHNTEESVVSAF